MARLLGSALLALAVVVAVPPMNRAKAQPTIRAERAAITATFRVREMACHGCAERIEDSLRKRAGVSKVVATLKAAEVAVTFDDATTSSKEIKQALDKLGFEATLVSERKDERKPS